MPIIDIDVPDRIQRHLRAVRIMSYMVFPDDVNLRCGAEITFRTVLADSKWGSFAKLSRKDQAQKRGGAKRFGHRAPGCTRKPIAMYEGETLRCLSWVRGRNPCWRPETGEFAVRRTD